MELKRQATIHMLVFGAEFLVMKQRIDVFRGISYELMMMGFPIFGLTYVYEDNVPFLMIRRPPRSTLK